MKRVGVTALRKTIVKTVLFLRSLLFYIGQMASIVVFFPVTLIARLLPPRKCVAVIGWWAGFIRFWLELTCNLKHNVSGEVPTVPVVIVSKHQSAWETIVFQAIFPPQVYVLKRELLRLPFFGWGLAAAHPVAIDRKAGLQALEQVVQEGKKRLQMGLSVVIFPEGTRVAPGTRRRYTAGGARLAIAAGVPVVPVAHNAGVFWSKDGFIKMPGVINVKIGDPIDTKDREARELTDEIADWIEKTCQDL